MNSIKLLRAQYRLVLKVLDPKYKMPVERYVTSLENKLLEVSEALKTSRVQAGNDELNYILNRINDLIEKEL